MASSEQPPQMPPSMQASPPPPTYAQQQQQRAPPTTMNVPTADANPSQGVATSNIDAYLLPRLRAQIEFYFSPQNLARDNYLRSVLYHYGGAAAPLSVIASFPKVRDLVATTLGTPNAPADPSLLMRALEGSSIVAVSPDAMWISPLLPMPPMDPTNTRQFMPQNLHQSPLQSTANHMGSVSSTSQSSQSSVTEKQPQQITPNLSDEQQNSTDGTKSERSTVIVKSVASPVATPPSSNSKGSVTPSPSDVKTSSSPQKSVSSQADQQQMPTAPPTQHGRNVQLPSTQYQVAPTMTHMTPPHGPQPIPTGIPGAPYAAYPYNYRHYTPVAVPNPHQYPNAATYQHIPANMQQSGPVNPQPLQYAPQMYPSGYPYVQVQGMQGMNRYYGAGPYRSDSGGRAGANMPMAENGQARQYSNGSHHAKNRQQVDNPKQLRKSKLKKGFGSNQQIVDSNGNIIAQRWRGNGIGPNVDGNGYTENDPAASGKGGGKSNYNNRNRYDNMARHRSQSELSEVSGVDSTGDSKYSKKKKKNKKRDGDTYRSNDKKESTKPDYSFDSSSFPALSPAKDKEGTEDMKQTPQVTAFSGYADALRQANKVKASGTKLDDSSSHVASMSNGEQLEEINEGVATMNITNEKNEKAGSNEGVSGGTSESITTLETTESTPEVTPEVKDVKAPKVESEAKQSEGNQQTTNGIAETTTQSVDTKESTISKEMVPNMETGNSLGDHDKPAASSHEASLPVTPSTNVTDESKDEVQTTAVSNEAPQSTWGNKRSFIDVVMKQP